MQTWMPKRQPPCSLGPYRAWSCSPCWPATWAAFAVMRPVSLPSTSVASGEHHDTHSPATTHPGPAGGGSAHAGAVHLCGAAFGASGPGGSDGGHGGKQVGRAIAVRYRYRRSAQHLQNRPDGFRSPADAHCGGGRQREGRASAWRDGPGGSGRAPAGAASPRVPSAIRGGLLGFFEDRLVLVVLCCGPPTDG